MLTENQVFQLKLAHKQTREKRLADRIKAVLYVHFGLSYPEIAKLLLFDEVTVRRYCKQFQEKGVEGLLEYRYTGGQPRLTITQEAALKEFLKANTKRTAKEVTTHIKNMYGVEFSVIGVTKLLHRLGFTYKKPKLIPGKVDSAKQAAFLKIYQETKESLGQNDRMYFVDSSHPQHNVQPDYGWILKGKMNDKFVKSNSGRERLNLNGAFNFQDKTTVVLEETTINATALINLLEEIKKKQKAGKVYIILDNAKHHHARLIRRWRLHHPRFKFIFLPAYSPNLNLIERLWRFFHQQVTWNRYFETFEEFKRETLTFFKNLKQYEKELATLMTDNFQLLPTQ
jgi:transposase